MRFFKSGIIPRVRAFYAQLLIRMRSLSPMVWTIIYAIFFILSIPLAYLVYRIYDLWKYCQYYPCEYLHFL